MNEPEAFAVLTRIEGLWDHAPVREGQPEAWAAALADVPAGLVMGAVVRLARSEPRPPSVAAVRAAIADAAGLLPVPDHDAFSLAQHVASQDGVGRLMLPPLVRRIYDEFGGAQGPIRSSSPTVRAQFRDAYRQAREVAVREVVTGDLGQQLALASADRADRKAVGGGA